MNNPVVEKWQQEINSLKLSMAGLIDQKDEINRKIREQPLIQQRKELTSKIKKARHLIEARSREMDGHIKAMKLLEAEGYELTQTGSQQEEQATGTNGKIKDFNRR